MFRQYGIHATTGATNAMTQHPHGSKHPPTTNSYRKSTETVPLDVSILSVMRLPSRSSSSSVLGCTYRALYTPLSKDGCSVPLKRTVKKEGRHKDWKNHWRPNVITSVLSPSSETSSISVEFW